MDLTQLLAYLLAILIGLSLGLIGSGGSILTVPILVYLLAIEPVLATAYSLFIVGITALVGLIRNIPKKLVDFKIGIVFALPAFFAVYITRKYLLPAIPDTLADVYGFQITKNVAIMVFFAFIMLLAAISMIKNKQESTIEIKHEAIKLNYGLIIIDGFVVGILTGLVGAGGGFLIIPALVLLAKLPMKKAVATSLMIIAIKSLIGFVGDVENLQIDWRFLLTFSTFSIFGIFIGTFLNNWIDGKKLKKSFGWFVLLMAIYILIKEFL